MKDFFLVLALAALPSVGSFAGGALAELRPPTARRLNYALHAAAGIVLAVVAVELMPRALDQLPAWMIGLAFAMGGLLYIALKTLVWQLGVLMVGAGLLTVAAVEDMVGEAHEGFEDERRSLVALVGGFVLFTLVSEGLSA